MRRAFTLIEILTVTAILALLVAILFPVFAAARENGRATACAANLRQLGLAFGMYTDDWQRYPGSGRAWWPERGDWVRTRQFWQPHPEQGSLWSYTRNQELYRCPSNDFSMNYAMNELLEHRNPARARPDTPLLVDQEGPIPWGDETRGGPDDGSFSPYAPWDRLIAVHNGRGNVLLTDGHVERWQARRLLCDTDCRLRLFAP